MSETSLRTPVLDREIKLIQAVPEILQGLLDMLDMSGYCLAG